MSELNNSITQSSLNTASTTAYEKWRLLKDAIMRRAVVAGGLSVIFAIVVIFFYLLYVVYPLFLSADAEPVAQYSIPEENEGKTLFLAIEEQNEIAANFIFLFSFSALGFINIDIKSKFPKEFCPFFNESKNLIFCWRTIVNSSSNLPFIFIDLKKSSQFIEASFAEDKNIVDL